METLHSISPITIRRAVEKTISQSLNVCDATSNKIQLSMSIIERNSWTRVLAPVIYVVYEAYKTKHRKNNPFCLIRANILTILRLFQCFETF